MLGSFKETFKSPPDKIETAVDLCTGSIQYNCLLKKEATHCGYVSYKDDICGLNRKCPLGLQIDLKPFKEGRLDDKYREVFLNATKLEKHFIKLNLDCFSEEQVKEFARIFKNPTLLDEK